MNDEFTLNGEIINDDLLHSIIDDLNSNYKPLSDEKMVEDYQEYGVFERSFLHISRKITTIRWSVYYGTPETVRTFFESVSNK